MIILDTNVLSALMRQKPDLAITSWLDRQPRESMWTSSVTIMEIRVGLETMAQGRRRQTLVAAFERLIDEGIEHRVADFDQSATEHAATLMVARRSAGTPGDLRDTMIAGIALARRAALATRNVKHFDDAGLDLVNPWEA
jgi:hypothetical protein